MLHRMVVAMDSFNIDRMGEHIFNQTHPQAQEDEEEKREEAEAYKERIEEILKRDGKHVDTGGHVFVNIEKDNTITIMSTRDFYDPEDIRAEMDMRVAWGAMREAGMAGTCFACWKDQQRASDCLVWTNSLVEDCGIMDQEEEE